MSLEELGRYQNGNYTVTIYEDGTKVRENDLDNLTPEFPENIDLKITNYCDMNCPMCHENSTIYGHHGDILNAKFIDSLRPYTELAIGGGNALAHPDLSTFLIKLKAKNIIPNLTVNLKHFVENYDFLKVLLDTKLIYGLGVSVPNDANEEDLLLLKDFDNIVVHVINGIVSIDLLNKLNKIGGLKVLILGYKTLRRGENYKKQNNKEVNRNMDFLYKNLGLILNISTFKVVSFDNLALEQLNVKNILNKDKWNKLYMGDDGSYTMYIDAVTEEYAMSSTSLNRHKVTDNIIDMFNTIRKDKEQINNG